MLVDLDLAVQVYILQEWMRMWRNAKGAPYAVNTNRPQILPNSLSEVHFFHIGCVVRENLDVGELLQ